MKTMSQKRIDLQPEVAEIAERRYGVQVTTANRSGIALFVTWRMAERLRADLRRLERLGWEAL